MHPISLTERVRVALEAAREHDNGLEVVPLVDAQPRLRQLIVALTAGSELPEHEAPLAATLHVLHGSIELRAGAQTWQVSQGELMPIPDERHSVWAAEESAFLLTRHDGAEPGRR